MAWGRWRGSGRAPVRVREGLRLSPNEERYILAETHTGQVYAAPSATRIKGRDIDPAAALAAFQATCDNHEARRTGFELGPDGGFTKYVEDRATVHLEQRSMPGASDEALIAAVNAHCLRKGDLSPGELHRFILITVGPQEYVFGMALHHATSDAMTQRAFGLEVLARTLDLRDPRRQPSTATRPGGRFRPTSMARPRPLGRPVCCVWTRRRRTRRRRP